MPALPCARTILGVPSLQRLGMIMPSGEIQVVDAT
jgi:hypothetical protein